MNTTPYPGDVLEHALNNGVASAAARYDLPQDEVKGIVQQFAKEVNIGDMRCACEIANAEGDPVMCIFCSGPVNPPRISI